MTKYRFCTDPSLAIDKMILPLSCRTHSHSEFVHNEVMQRLKHLEAEEIASKNDKLNIYAQIIGTRRRESSVPGLSGAILKIAQPTYQMARVTLHMSSPSDKPATCPTTVTANQKPALVEIDHVTAAAPKGWLPCQ